MNIIDESAVDCYLNTQRKINDLVIEKMLCKPNTAEWKQYKERIENLRDYSKILVNQMKGENA